MITRLLAIATALLAAAAVHAGAVTLKSDAVLPAGAEHITIRHVARVDVPGESLSATIAGATLRITPSAANEANVIRVSREDIEHALADAGVRRSLVTITGGTLDLRLHPRDPRRTTTAPEEPTEDDAPSWHTTAQAEGSHPLLDAVIATVLADHAADAHRVRIRLDRPSQAKLDQTPHDDRFAIERVSTPNSSRGVFRVTTFDADDAPNRPFNIAIDIEVELDALVLTGDVRRGDTIAADTYTQRRIWRAPAAVSLLTLEGTALQPIAKTRLDAGTVLTTVNTEPPILVKRRQAVRVHAHADGIAVRVDAVALEDGALGDLIRCRPLSRARARGDEGVFLARVTAAGELTFADAAQ